MSLGSYRLSDGLEGAGMKVCGQFALRIASEPSKNASLQALARSESLNQVAAAPADI